MFHLRSLPRLIALFIGIASMSFLASPALAADAKPNIIFIMADDLGYGDLGCFGQKLIQTPHLDQMAKEGTRFTSVYAGSTVCAPSRCVLMTGLHTGHARIRGNARVPLEPDDVTVAEVLEKATYRTALCGKWGLGEPESTGIPNKQGFHHFFGYLNQHHAHNYYPAYLWRNETKVTLRNEVPGGDGGKEGFGQNWATKRIDYSHDLVMEDALKWVKQNATGRSSQPFFLYLALTIPHANNEGTRGTGDGQEVPDYGIYKDKDWTNPNKGQAAMITRMDADLGRLFALLKELKVDENTIVFFTSDNGPHNEGGHTPKLFNPSGPLRGMKRDLYEGGIRVPTIVRWPGKVPAGREDDTPWSHVDVLPTFAELAGVSRDALPDKLDGRSIVPLLMGKDAPRDLTDRALYWEFYERGFAQAVRKGAWKAVRKGHTEGKTELYDLSSDIGETKDLAGDHPEVVKVMERIMAQEHVDDPNWKVRGK
ncbi:MAG: arylsulfatase [Phycisphaeraceae bacterium]